MSKRLSGDALIKLRAAVAKRDKYRCRVCGKRNNLHYHHIIFRTCGGEDSIDNLILLCFTHHNQVHGIGVAPFDIVRNPDGELYVSACWKGRNIFFKI